MYRAETVCENWIKWLGPVMKRMVGILCGNGSQISLKAGQNEVK
jgi:hypothetical protein